MKSWTSLLALYGKVSLLSFLSFMQWLCPWENGIWKKGGCKYHGEQSILQTRKSWSNDILLKNLSSFWFSSLIDDNFLACLMRLPCKWQTSQHEATIRSSNVFCSITSWLKAKYSRSQLILWGDTNTCMWAFYVHGPFYALFDSEMRKNESVMDHVLFWDSIYYLYFWCQGFSLTVHSLFAWWAVHTDVSAQDSDPHLF